MLTSRDGSVEQQHGQAVLYCTLIGVRCLASHIIAPACWSPNAMHGSIPMHDVAVWQSRGWHEISEFKNRGKYGKFACLPVTSALTIHVSKVRFGISTRRQHNANQFGWITFYFWISPSGAIILQFRRLCCCKEHGYMFTDHFNRASNWPSWLS